MNISDFSDSLNDEELKKKAAQDKAEHIGAINKAGIKTVQAVDRVAKGQGDLAKSTDLENVTDAIHKMNVTTFITNDGLPKLAQGLSDFTDKIKTLSDTYKDQGFEKLAQSLDTTVGTLKDVAKKLSDTKIKVDMPLKKTLDDLNSNIKAIDFNPTVNVPAPKVSVSTPKVDVTPIRDVIKEHLNRESGELDLSKYRAQDLDELEPGVQYVGFVNPDGNWYIVKNNEEENTLRYAFGTDAYDSFWPQASKLDYKRLDEAVHAVPA
jgi:hypothetical protein